MHQLINGSHYSKVAGYFEWWYFHFASQNDFILNIVLHETDIFGLTKSPYVSMSRQLPHHEPQYSRMEISPESIERGSEYLSQSDGYFQESGREIQIQLAFLGVSFEVVITKLAEPLTLNNCVLYQDADKRSCWKLQVPFGRFSGVLKTSGKEYLLEGWAYHDHQWGNIPIQCFVADWVWGHFSSDFGSATFYTIRTQTGGLIERYAVVTPQGVQASVNHSKAPHLMKLVQSDSPNLWQSEPVVAFPFGATLKTRISPAGILRSRMNEAHPGFVATYIRWLGEAHLSSFKDSLYGITEYIRIRKGN